ncbi:MAG: hypothetical protein KDB61_13060, partial [Planctomycetes bacterium]|nr:hypothetical protein [Planctomycetota bacterium]
QHGRAESGRRRRRGEPLDKRALLILAMGLTPMAAGQDKGDLSKVGRTDREQLHPGEALKIRGIAQGANDFLASTPALRGAPTAVELVAAEDAHARRLAMYTEGRRYTSAPSQAKPMLAANPGVPVHSTGPAQPGATPETRTEAPTDESNRWLLPGIILGLILFVGRKLTR